MKKIVLYPLMSLGVILSLYILSLRDNNVSRKYTFKQISDTKAFAGAKDAIEYAELMYKDVVTGKVELAKLASKR